MGPISSDSTFILTCSGTNGSATRSTTVYRASYLRSIDFNTPEEYQSLLRLRESASHEHLPNGGWDGGGAAKFYPPGASFGTYSGLGVISLSQPQSELYVRWCMYLGPTFNASVVDGGKPLIMSRSGVTPADTARVITHFHTYQTGRLDMYVDNNIDTGPPVFPFLTLDNRAQQWICLEVGVSVTQNFRKFWVTTQDGSYNDTLVQTGALNTTQGLWSGLDGLAGFFGPTNNNAGSYYILDDVKIANTKVGPPPGFVN